MQIVMWAPRLNVVAARTRTLDIVRRWSVPPTFYDTLTDTVQPWAPGQYTRSIAVTAEGRDTLPSVADVPFTILEDCE
jgi:hypothetical protein